MAQHHQQQRDKSTRLKYPHAINARRPCTRTLGPANQRLRGREDASCIVSPGGRQHGRNTHRNITVRASKLNAFLSSSFRFISSLFGGCVVLGIGSGIELAWGWVGSRVWDKMLLIRRREFDLNKNSTGALRSCSSPGLQNQFEELVRVT